MGYSWSRKVLFSVVFSVDENRTLYNAEKLHDCFIAFRFRSMAPMYYRKTNAAIIVYDITSSKSFEQAKEWVDGKRRHIVYHLYDSLFSL